MGQAKSGLLRQVTS